MKTLLLGLALAAGSAAATESSFYAPQRAAQAPHPALYSFADVYRLTLAGPMSGLPPLDVAGEAPIRVAAAQLAQPPEPRFSIAAAPAPDKWLLLLAGLALAGWVAHRRLVYSF